MIIEKSAYAFRLDGKPTTCEVFGHGHINHTLKLTTDTGAEYVLQKINECIERIPSSPALSFAQAEEKKLSRELAIRRFGFEDLTAEECEIFNVT